MKKKRKKSKKTITIRGKLVKKWGEHELIALGDTLVVQPKTIGKVMDSEGALVISKKGAVSSLWLEEKGRASVHIDCTHSQLRALVSKLDKDVRKFKDWDKKRKKSKLGMLPPTCVRHLSPDVSFLVDYSK